MPSPKNEAAFSNASALDDGQALFIFEANNDMSFNKDGNNVIQPSTSAIANQLQNHGSFSYLQKDSSMKNHGFEMGTISNNPIVLNSHSVVMQPVTLSGVTAFGNSITHSPSVTPPNLKNYSRIISPNVFQHVPSLSSSSHASNQYVQTNSQQCRKTRGGRGGNRGGSSQGTRKRKPISEFLPVLQSDKVLCDTQPQSIQASNLQTENEGSVITVRENLYQKQQFFQQQKKEIVVKQMPNKEKWSISQRSFDTVQFLPPQQPKKPTLLPIITSAAPIMETQRSHQMRKIDLIVPSSTANDSSAFPPQIERPSSLPNKPKSVRRRNLAPRKPSFQPVLKGVEFYKLDSANQHATVFGSHANDVEPSIPKQSISDDPLESTIDSVASGGGGSFGTFAYFTQTSNTSSFSSSPKSSHFSLTPVGTPAKRAPRKPRAPKAQSTKRTAVNSTSPSDTVKEEPPLSLPEQSDGTLKRSYSQQTLCRIHVQNPPNMLPQNFPPTETKIHVVHQTSLSTEPHNTHIQQLGSAQSLISPSLQKSFGPSPSTSNFVPLSSEKSTYISVQCPSMPDVQDLQQLDEKIQSQPLPTIKKTRQRAKTIRSQANKPVNLPSDREQIIIDALKSNSSSYFDPLESVSMVRGAQNLLESANKQFAMPSSSPEQSLFYSPPEGNSHQLVKQSNQTTYRHQPQQQVQQIMIHHSSKQPYMARQSVQIQLAANKDAEFRKYSVKLYHLQRTIKALVYKNGALADEIARLNQRIQTTSDERIFLAKRLQHHERNRARRIHAQNKRLNAAALRKINQEQSDSQSPISLMEKKDGDSNIQSFEKNGFENVSQLKHPLSVDVIDKKQEQHDQLNTYLHQPLKSPSHGSFEFSNCSPKLLLESPSTGRYVRQSRSAIRHLSGDIETNATLADDNDHMVLRSRSSSSTEFGGIGHRASTSTLSNSSNSADKSASFQRRETRSSSRQHQNIQQHDNINATPNGPSGKQIKQRIRNAILNNSSSLSDVGSNSSNQNHEQNGKDLTLDAAKLHLRNRPQHNGPKLVPPFRGSLINDSDRRTKMNVSSIIMKARMDRGAHQNPMQQAILRPYGVSGIPATKGINSFFSSKVHPGGTAPIMAANQRLGNPYSLATKSQTTISATDKIQQNHSEGVSMKILPQRPMHPGQIIPIRRNKPPLTAQQRK